jgi:hypothetical protein
MARRSWGDGECIVGEEDVSDPIVVSWRDRVGDERTRREDDDSR